MAGLFFIPSNPACAPFNPDPPRVWTRFDGRCIRCNERPCDNNTRTCLECTQHPSNYDLDMRRKAETLQYKKNNAQLSKKQKWAQMVRGNGPGAKTAWATQTVDYTNPNIRNLEGKLKFLLICPRTPVTCAARPQCDVPGQGPQICMDKTVPLTRYIPRRVYKAGGTKWPERKWQPGDDGFPRWKAGTSS